MISALAAAHATPPLLESSSAYSDNLIHAFAAGIRALGPFGPAPHITVALSGGADSMACALLANHWARTHGGRITALTVDHGLRAESRHEAEQVAAWMQARGIAHHILTPPHYAHSNNLQENARQWRYDALSDWCRTHDVLHCLLAHHAGDQRETVALHTTRGHTADGGSGMSVARNYRGVRFLRPVFGQEKSDLVAFLDAINAPWIEDPSNQNPAFARVRTRAALQGDDAYGKSLANITQQEGKARVLRDDALAHTAVLLVTMHPAGYAELPREAWAALPHAQATQLLADLLTTISGATTRPRQQNTQRLAHALATQPPSRRTLHGCEITPRNGIIRIAREFARVQALLTLTGSGSVRWDSRFSVHYTLPTNAALTLAPLGTYPKALWPERDLPRATPALWHLDRCMMLPHMTVTPLPEAMHVRMGFAPAKPLAATPFWWLKDK